MPQGITIFDASGNVSIDTTNQLMTLFGTVNLTSTTPLVINDARFALGIPWYVLRRGPDVGQYVTMSMAGTQMTLTATTAWVGSSTYNVWVSYGIF